MQRLVTLSYTFEDQNDNLLIFISLNKTNHYFIIFYTQHNFIFQPTFIKVQLVIFLTYLLWSLTENE